MVARQLEWAGYAVTTTGDGDEALDLAAAERLDAVVLEANRRAADRAHAAGPGFVNLRLRPNAFRTLLPIILTSGEAYGDATTGTGTSTSTTGTSSTTTGSGPVTSDGYTTSLQSALDQAGL